MASSGPVPTRFPFTEESETARTRPALNQVHDSHSSTPSEDPFVIAAVVPLQESFIVRSHAVADIVFRQDTNSTISGRESAPDSPIGDYT